MTNDRDKKLASLVDLARALVEKGAPPAALRRWRRGMELVLPRVPAFKNDNLDSLFAEVAAQLGLPSQTFQSLRADSLPSDLRNEAKVILRPYLAKIASAGTYAEYRQLIDWCYEIVEELAAPGNERMAHSVVDVLLRQRGVDRKWAAHPRIAPPSREG